jgi:hypothetical protein
LKIVPEPGLGGGLEITENHVLGSNVFNQLAPQLFANSNLNTNT